MKQTTMIIIGIVLFATMINLAIHQVTVEQDKEIRDSAYNYVFENCLQEQQVDGWVESLNLELEINITEGIE